MFGEISVMAWLGGAIMLAIGGGAGFFVARQIKDKRTLELEQQLASTQNKLSEYQDDVNRHFLKTSLLFNKLTDNYREVYDHLATGAQKLCNEKPLTTALDLPETKILSAAVNTNTDAVITAEEKPNVDAVTSTETEHDDAAHLGAEGFVATEEITPASAETNLAETNLAENTTAPETNVAKQATAEQSATDIKMTKPDTTEKAATTEKSDDSPTISKKELKELEASERKKTTEEEDVHLGAESTPGEELAHHKTHPRIH